MKCIGDCKYSKLGKCTNDKSLENNRCMVENYKKKLKVRYTDNKDNKSELTLNKEYEVIEEIKHNYKIINDFKIYTGYDKEAFDEVKEEQLEYAQDKESHCYNKKCQENDQNGYCMKKYIECDVRMIKYPIFYEGEYNKLKKENEGLQENAKEETKYREKINKINDNYSAKITLLEQDNKEYKKANEGLAEESKERTATIKKLQRLIEDNTENAILNNKVYDLEKENIELKEELRKWNDKELKIAIQEGIKAVKKCGEALEEKNKKIELLESQLENELGRNRVLQEKTIKFKLIESELLELKKHNNQDYMEQMNITLNEKNEEIKRLTQKNGMNEAYLITYEKIIKNQKEAIQAMAKLI